MIEIIPNWHPLLVHFTIALITIAVILYLLSGLLRQHKWRAQWLSAANWNLWLGSGITVLTLLAGWYAYNTVAHDTPSHEAMTEHRNWAIATAVLIIALAAWSVVLYRQAKPPGIAFMGVALLIGAMLMSTGWHGAEAVYRYGLGVMSLPQSEGEGHAHEHADGEGHGDMATDSLDTGEPGHADLADDHHDDPIMEDHHDTPLTDDHHSESIDNHGHTDAGTEKGTVHTHADGTVERH